MSPTLQRNMDSLEQCAIMMGILRLNLSYSVLWKSLNKRSTVQDEHDHLFRLGSQ
jgi:hypothetical protein